MADSYVLRPRPPFSFDQALTFLRRFPPTIGERAIVDGAVLAAARVGGRTVGIRLASEGDLEAPSLRCTLAPGGGTTGRLDGATADVLLTRLGGWLGLDDPGPFYALAEADPPFRTLVRRLYGYHQVRFFTPFENACWAILGQRTPIGSARAEKRRLMERYGGAVDVDGQTLLAFPEPADLARGDGQDLAAVVGSERKADRLLAIARAFADAGEAHLAAMPTVDLGAWLQALPGIGPWSVGFILLRGFGRADAPLPLGATQTFDRELLRAAQVVYGARMTAADLEIIAERYGTHRGSWGHYLRMSA